MDKEKLLNWVLSNSSFNGKWDKGKPIFEIDRDELKEAIQNGEFDKQPCEYCDGQEKDFGNYGLYSIKGNELLFVNDCYLIGIRYCPMCGRKLGC
jgi:hypothetical protein